MTRASDNGDQNGNGWSTLSKIVAGAIVMSGISSIAIVGTYINGLSNIVTANTKVSESNRDAIKGLQTLADTVTSNKASATANKDAIGTRFQLLYRDLERVEAAIKEHVHDPCGHAANCAAVARAEEALKAAQSRCEAVHTEVENIRRSLESMTDVVLRLQRQSGLEPQDLEIGRTRHDKYGGKK